MMKVFHIISGISKTTGGPSRSVQGLIAGLRGAGMDAWLMAFRPSEIPWVAGVTKYKFFDLSCDWVRELFGWINEKKPDIVHLHGIWDWNLHKCVAICRKLGVPYIIAPRGMLEAWSLRQKWFKKWIARLLYQDRDIKHAAALHATAESEAEQFRNLGFRNKVIVSPNGVNLPVSFYHEAHVDKRILFVSRMHPKKGILELVEAFTACSKELNNWIVELVYTVNGEFEREYETKVKERVKELWLEERFIFTGALNDDEKWEAYSRADLFVLPTYSENFGIVVAEALWAGVPVITTKGTPWQELEEYKCGWWIDIGVDLLTSALKEAMSLDDIKRQEMGKRGHALVKEKYTWDAVVKTMVNGYEEILHGRT